MPFKLGIEVDFDVEFLFFSEITMLSAGSRRLATLIAPFFDNLLFAILLSRRFPACTQQGIFRYSINISKKLLPGRNVRTKADVGAKL